MQLSGDVPGYLKPQPASAVVVNTIHVVLGEVGAVFVADHGMPGVGKVIPAPAILFHPDENRAHAAACIGKRSVLAGEQQRNAVKMVDDHFIGEDFASE